MSLHKVLVDQDWAASRGQAQDKRPFWSRIEGFDAFYVLPLARFTSVQGIAGSLTNDIVGDILGRSLRIVSDDQPPRSGKRTVVSTLGSAYAYMMDVSPSGLV